MFKVSGQSLVGHALGAGRPDEARDVVAHLYGWAVAGGSAADRRHPGAVAVLPHVVQRAIAARAARATVALVVLAAMQLPAAVTFVLDGVLMGANDFRDLRWQTTLAFAACLPVFVAVMVATLARHRRRSGSACCCG